MSDLNNQVALENIRCIGVRYVTCTDAVQDDTNMQLVESIRDSTCPQLRVFGIGYNAENGVMDEDGFRVQFMVAAHMQYSDIDAVQAHGGVTGYVSWLLKQHNDRFIEHPEYSDVRAEVFTNPRQYLYFVREDDDNRLATVVDGDDVVYLVVFMCYKPLQPIGDYDSVVYCPGVINKCVCYCMSWLYTVLHDASPVLDAPVLCWQLHAACDTRCKYEEVACCTANLGDDTARIVVRSEVLCLKDMLFDNGTTTTRDCTTTTTITVDIEMPLTTSSDFAITYNGTPMLRTMSIYSYPIYVMRIRRDEDDDLNYTYDAHRQHIIDTITNIARAVATDFSHEYSVDSDVVDIEVGIN